MSRTAIKWAVILGLMAVIGWTCYQWGASDTRADMAEAREEAVRDAVEKARAEQSRLEQRARAQERDQLDELRSKLETLRERDEAVDEYRRSDQAQECALDDEALKLYRRY